MQYWPLLSRIDNTLISIVVDINVHCDPIFYKISKKKEKGRLKSILMSRFLTIGFYKYIHHLEQNEKKRKKNPIISNIYTLSSSTLNRFKLLNLLTLLREKGQIGIYICTARNKLA